MKTQMHMLSIFATYLLVSLVSHAVGETQKDSADVGSAHPELVV